MTQVFRPDFGDDGDFKTPEDDNNPIMLATGETHKMVVVAALLAKLGGRVTITDEELLKAPVTVRWHYDATTAELRIEAL